MKPLLFWIGLHVSLWAHPHFFIDTDVTIEKTNILHRWTFDALNSKLLLFEFDSDKNGILDHEEASQFLRAHFYPLEANRYNIVLQSGENELLVKPSDVNVTVEKKRIIVAFVTQNALSKPSTLCTIDATLYIAYALRNVQSLYAYEVQKSDVDFCLGVTP